METAPCYLCRSTQFDAPLTIGRAGQQIVRCRSCGLARTLPGPEGEIAGNSPTFSDDRSSFLRKASDLANLRRLESLTGGRKFFDAGFGGGQVALLAQKRGWRVFGCDSDPKRADLGRKIFGPGFILGDILTANPPDAPYDVVYARFVLEHLPDPVLALRALRSLCAPDGYLMIQVPNCASIQARLFGRRWFQWMPHEHYFHFSPGSLSRLIKSAGFEVIEVSTPFTAVDLLGLSKSILSDTPNTSTNVARITFFDYLVFVLGIVPSIVASIAGRGSTLRILAKPIIDRDRDV
jgi:SAM-dependent methyltransferase